MSDDKSISLLGTKLDDVCDYCKGDGNNWPHGQCSNCRGSGYAPTDEGEKLLNFIHRHVSFKGN